MAFCTQCGKPLNGEQPPAHAKCAAAAGLPAPDPAPGPAPALLMDTAPLAPGPIITPPAASARPAVKGRTMRLTFSGRPRTYPGILRWVGAGVFRNWRGVVTSIICGWFQIPFAVILATMGAILGGITGAVSGTAYGPGIVDRLNVFTKWIFPLPLDGGVGDLVPVAALQIGMTIGALWGAFTGAIQLGWIALYYPWAALGAGDPAWPVQVFLGQVIMALFTGTLYTVWSIATEGWRLRLKGARRLSRREEAWLRPILEECAAKMRLGGIPILRVTDSREVNAYAVTRHIVIHRGLLEHLSYDRDMVAGVIAHELAHWAHGDGVSRLFVKGVGLPLYLMYQLAYYLLKASARVRPMQWLLRILLWGVTTTTRFFVGPANYRAWRREEEDADARAKAAGYGDGLRNALALFAESFDGGADGWDEVMMRSHPPNELRMGDLEEEGKTYPLIGSAGPARAAGGSAVAGADTSTADRGW